MDRAIHLPPTPGYAPRRLEEGEFSPDLVKKFAMRGNVIDLAIAVVLGAAFTAIVNSLVNDIFMPLLGIIIGGIDFSSLKASVLGVDVLYGNFIQQIVSFFLIAIALFLLVKVINRLQREKEVEEAAIPTPTKEEQLLTEIRDLLKDRSL